MAADGLLFSKYFASDLHVESNSVRSLKEETNVPAVSMQGMHDSSSDSDQGVEDIREQGDKAETSNKKCEVSEQSADEIGNCASNVPLIDITPDTHSPSPSTSTPTKAVDSTLSNEECISPMLTDPTLPPGWTRKVTQRTMGASAGKYDVYIFSPDGKKIRSKTDLMLYLIKNKADLDPNSFDFSVRGRANTPVKRPSLPRTPRSIKAKKETSKLAIDSQEMKRKKLSKSSTVSTGSSNAQSQSALPKLVVKFNFPIARVKRSASMKTKKTKRKVVRQDSHTSQASQTSQASEARESQTSDHSHTSGHVAQFECHEVLSNGEARLTNGLDFEDEEEVI